MQHFIMHKSGNNMLYLTCIGGFFFKVVMLLKIILALGPKCIEKSSRKQSSSLDFMKTNTHLDT